MSALQPVEPADPGIRLLTERQVAEMIEELRSEGREFGVLLPSATTHSVVDGRVLVTFGNGPTSTVINLLALLREFKRERGRQ
ncbi:hypothetical protein ACFVVX_06820 [Kitasatospora sp. NPDC058170]|uniref:hypothetical protein n=1 Tax=Kitasatospora sp. NPDC058170 TaxID=3346364 RepID=UPI0036D7BE2B